MVDMLTILALELDSTGVWRQTILDVLDSLDTNNDHAESAAQQLVNGLYRCVELSAIVAMELG